MSSSRLLTDLGHLQHKGLARLPAEARDPDLGEEAQRQEQDRCLFRWADMLDCTSVAVEEVARYLSEMYHWAKVCPFDVLQPWVWSLLGDVCFESGSEKAVICK